MARSHRLADHLAGVLNEDGGRQNGELDKHLPTHEVSMILAESAEIFRRQSHDTAKAEMSARLFMLAGRFGSLLTLLNELISPTNVDDEQRRYVAKYSMRHWGNTQRHLTLIFSGTGIGVTNLKESLTPTFPKERSF